MRSFAFGVWGVRGPPLDTDVRLHIFNLLTPGFLVGTMSNVPNRLVQLVISDWGMLPRRLHEQDLV